MPFVWEPRRGLAIQCRLTVWTYPAVRVCQQAASRVAVHDAAIFSTSRCVTTAHMVWVWVVLSVFVLWTLGVSLMRHENTPRALWEAIIANAVFGALVFLRGL